MAVQGAVTGKLSSDVRISGSLTPAAHLDGSLSVQSATIAGDLSSGVQLSGTLATAAHLDGSLTIPASIGEQIYDGPVEVTPGGMEQTLATEGKLLLQDIVINPIPSNYGLISWNGLGIRVS